MLWITFFFCWCCLGACCNPPFIVLRYLPYSLCLLRDFYHEGILNFVKVPSASHEIIRWLLSFSLLTCYVRIIDLHIWHHPYISGSNPTWSWWIIFLMRYLLDLVCKYFIETFYIYIHKGSWPISLSFVVPLCGLGVRVIVKVKGGWSQGHTQANQSQGPLMDMSTHTQDATSKEATSKVMIFVASLEGSFGNGAHSLGLVH